MTGVQTCAPSDLLCMFDTDTGESKIIHSASGLGSIIEIDFNGRYLMWRERNSEVDCMKLADMENGNEEVVVPGLKSTYSEVGMTEDYLFWFDLEEETHMFAMYRYDFETKNKVKLIQTDSILGNYNIEVSQKVISILIYKKNVTTIQGYDFNGNLLYNYNTKESVCEFGSCNSYGAVWLNSDNQEVHFYDSKADKVYNLGNAISFEQIEDCIIINDYEHGVYSYKVGSNIQKHIIRTPENYMVGMSEDVNGDIHGKWIIPMQSYSSGENEFLLLKVSQSIK